MKVLMKGFVGYIEISIDYYSDDGFCSHLTDLARWSRLIQYGLTICFQYKETEFTIVNSNHKQESESNYTYSNHRRYQ